MSSLGNAPLGKNSPYISQYDPSLLFPIPRKIKRDEIGITDKTIFYGYDIWNAYELSWLNSKGKPEVAIVTLDIDAHTTNIIESKSLKLYFNSFNQSKFANREMILNLLHKDLASALEGDVNISLYGLHDINNQPIQGFKSICIDQLDVECSKYLPDAALLKAYSDTIVEEKLYSDLLKSNCLVTSQPDWASIEIDYHGQAIDHASLLQYIVSFRNHNEFHEQCVERIFMDLLQQFKLERLTVYARYTRRGGLDINPIRSTHPIALNDLKNLNTRQARQ